MFIGLTIEWEVEVMYIQDTWRLCERCPQELFTCDWAMRTIAYSRLENNLPVDMLYRNQSGQNKSPNICI